MHVDGSQFKLSSRRKKKRRCRKETWPSTTHQRASWLFVNPLTMKQVHTQLICPSFTSPVDSWCPFSLLLSILYGTQASICHAALFHAQTKTQTWTHGAASISISQQEAVAVVEAKQGRCRRRRRRRRRRRSMVVRLRLCARKTLSSRPLLFFRCKKRNTWAIPRTRLTNQPPLRQKQKPRDWRSALRPAQVEKGSVEERT
ncbi:hypothetical protein IWZ00DRAFT_116037 [Phyllosticta capitalensis]